MQLELFSEHAAMLHPAASNEFMLRSETRLNVLLRWGYKCVSSAEHLNPDTPQAEF